MPTLGLVDLLAKLFVTRQQTITTKEARERTVLRLLILLVKRPHMFGHTDSEREGTGEDHGILTS